MQFILFLISGGIAALVNIGSRWGLSLWLPYPAAITVAYGLGMITAFLLFQRYVFQARQGNVTRQGLWFVLVNALALAQTLLVSVGLAEYLFPHWGFVWHAHDVAHVIGVLVPVATSFAAHKYLTFKERPCN